MLADNLKCVLACSYTLAVKAQNFHWNVEGPDFPQYHEFFSNLYEEINGNAIDRTAEFIRTLDEYAPGSFSRFLELSKIPEQTRIPRAELMMQELYNDNLTMIETLNEAFAAAEEENQQGIANFIAERLDAHGKHGWMLRSILKRQRA